MSHTGLRAFHLVALAGGFTKAARAGRVSQPTISAQVSLLEETHGVRLFDRRGRSVTPTPLGQSLFAITTRLFAAEDEAMALLEDTQTLTRGHLRVAADSASHVMPLLAELKRQHGGLTFSLRIGNSSDVLQQVLDYAADVAVTAKQTSDPRIHSVLLRRDKLVVFVPSGHRWANRGHISMADLNGQELVIRERGSITREVFEARMAEAGVKPAVLVEVQAREAVREAVVAGFGIGIIFDSEFGQDLACRKLAVPDAELAVAEYIVCLEERRRIPLIRGFFDVLVPKATPRKGASRQADQP